MTFAEYICILAEKLRYLLLMFKTSQLCTGISQQLFKICWHTQFACEVIALCSGHFASLLNVVFFYSNEFAYNGT